MRNEDPDLYVFLLTALAQEAKEMEKRMKKIKPRRRI